LLIAPEQLAAQRRNRVLVLAGGTQAEASSAMRRLASATHQHLRLEPGDTVIHSARVIPGNERVVHELFCDLLRQGVLLHTRHTDPGVHTSGHAGRSEQAQMIRWLRPQAFVPVHGTLHHLRAHAKLAESLGVHSTLVVENGTPVVVDATTLSRDEPVVHGRVSIAHGGQSLDTQTARRRIELSRSGIVVVSLVVGDDGGCLYGPEVTARGVPGVDKQAQVLTAVQREVLSSVRRLGSVRSSKVEDEVRRAVRRVLLESSRTRPVVLVQLMANGTRWGNRA
jgi:ribonuclease J